MSATLTNLKEQLQQLEKERSQLNTQSEYFEYTLDNLKRGENFVEVVSPNSVGINDPFLNDLMVQLSSLNKEKIDKSYSSKANNPVLQVIDRKIESTRKLLLENITNLVKSTNITLLENAERIELIKGKINRIPQSERSLISIERQFELNDNIYNYLLQKRADAGLALASIAPDKSVIDPARQLSKEPIFPNTKLIMAGAILLGLFMPILIMVSGDFLNTKVQGLTEVEKIIGAPVIGTIGKQKKEKIEAFLNGKKSVPEPRFNFMAVSIIKQLSTADDKVIAFTSSQKKEGKTLCSFLLARTLAGFGKKTVFLDADFYSLNKPVSSVNLQEVNSSGLSGYLSTGESLENTIQKTPFSNLFVIPSGSLKKGENTPVVSQELKLKALFEFLRKEFQIVIVDTPPALDQVEYLSMVEHFDLNVLVVRHGYSQIGRLKEVSTTLQNEKVKNLSLLLNFYEGKKLSRS